MAVSPRVQLSLKGRLLSEVAFVGPQLRIGRMRENDVVVNNLAVSRFHATLRREGDGFVLEDLGSENGTQLNGERIRGTVPISPSDVIQLGKYELRLVMQPGMAIAGPPKPKVSDAWDSSQTFLALNRKPPAQQVPPAKEPTAKPTSTPKAATKPPPQPAPAATPEAPKKSEPELDPMEMAELLPDEPGEAAVPDPEGLFAFGEEDLAAVADEPASQGSGFETDPMPGLAANPEQTSLFDFGGEKGAGQPAPEAPVAPSRESVAGEVLPPSAAEDSGEALHAGLIIQCEGKLHELRPWEDGDLTAGRANECDLMLADAGVSRRHALFSRTAEGHTVRDLGSVNGIYVNGQRTKQHVLSVGDVVRIESFELTFVLDRQPIGSEVSAPPGKGAGAHDTARATQYSLEPPAIEEDEPFDLAPLAGDPAEAPELSSQDVAAEPVEGALPGLDDDRFDLAPLGDEPNAAEEELPKEPKDARRPARDDGSIATLRLPASPEASLPEADLITGDGLDDDEKEADLQRAAEAVPVARAASPRPRGGIALRIAVDTDALSPRAREALAVLEDEGVTFSAQLSRGRSRDD
jgi:pSer/pThr/pTyr-binding forkhead associated (FHA) protein